MGTGVLSAPGAPGRPRRPRSAMAPAPPLPRRPGAAAGPRTRGGRAGRAEGGGAVTWLPGCEGTGRARASDRPAGGDELRPLRPAPPGAPPAPRAPPAAPRAPGALRPAPAPPIGWAGRELAASSPIAAGAAPAGNEVRARFLRRRLSGRHRPPVRESAHSRACAQAPPGAPRPAPREQRAGPGRDAGVHGVAANLGRRPLRKAHRRPGDARLPTRGFPGPNAFPPAPRHAPSLPAPAAVGAPCLLPTPAGWPGCAGLARPRAPPPRPPARVPRDGGGRAWRRPRKRKAARGARLQTSVPWAPRSPRAPSLRPSVLIQLRFSELNSGQWRTNVWSQGWLLVLEFTVNLRTQAKRRR